MCKIDVLGLKNLTQMKLCLDLIGEDLSFIDDEDYNDPKVYEHLRRGNTTNVFQMQKTVPTRMIKDFNVQDIDGLCAVNAGNRPGPLAKDKETGKSMVDQFIERVNIGSPLSRHERIDDILSPTFGMLWFQEQLINISMEMCGYSLGGADARVRKVITKKNMNKVAELKNEFIYGKQSKKDKNGKVIGISEKDSKYCIGAIRNGFTEEFALKIFAYFEDFAKYSFNKSHSFCYATLGYKTAYLDLYYPVEWAIACLTTDSNDGNSKDKNIETFNHCRKIGIKILPLDINKSFPSFSVDYDENGNKAIRYGFCGLNNCGAAIREAIVYMREKDGDFKDFDDFLDRVYKNNSTLREFALNNDKSIKFKNPFNKRNIEPLIFSGAFDSLESNRHKLINFFYDKRGIKEDKKKNSGVRLDENNYKLKDKLKYEHELFGAYVFDHPLAGDAFPHVDFEDVNDGDFIEVAGIFKRYDTATGKGSKKYYRVTLELDDGSTKRFLIRENVYSRPKYKSCISMFNSQKAKDGHLIFIVKGYYGRDWDNVNVKEIYRVVSKQEKLEEAKENEKILLSGDGASPVIGEKNLEDIENEILEGF